MEIHDAKQVVQAEILKAFKDTVHTKWPHRIAIYSSTGSGKSKAALECACWYWQCMSTMNHSQHPAYIICHSVASRDVEWPEQIALWAPDKELAKNNRRICYQSIKKVRDQTIPVVIMDEAHKMMNDTMDLFKYNTIGAVIILTATKPRNRVKRMTIEMVVGTNKFNLKVDTAVDKGLTNDYQVNLFVMELDNTIESVLDVDDHPITEKQAYLRFCQAIEEAKHLGWNNSRVKFAYINMIRFLASTKSKNDMVRYIISQYRERNRRFLIFCESIEQCNELSPYRMHTATDNTDYLRFKAGEINELATIRQIQEGANLPGVDRAIKIQVNSNPLNMVQTVGRLLRCDIGTTSTIAIPVFKGTFDETWVRKGLKEFDSVKVVRRVIPKELYWKP